MSSSSSTPLQAFSFRKPTQTLSFLAPIPFHGVLAKYVNLTTGCRNRYFVLTNGVLVYYKINNDHQVRQAHNSSPGRTPASQLRNRDSMHLQKLSLVEHELVSDSSRNLIGENVLVFDAMGKTCAPEVSESASSAGSAHVPPRLGVNGNGHTARRRRAEGTPPTTPRPVVQGVLHLQARQQEIPLAALVPTSSQIAMSIPRRSTSTAFASGIFPPGRQKTVAPWTAWHRHCIDWVAC